MTKHKEPKLRRMPGGFGSGMGSGGSGVSGKSARGASRVTTARDRDSKIERKSVPSGRLDMPTKVQLKRAMADQYCWWCGRTHTRKGKPMVNWGQHWARGHGFDLQDIRDILEVPKRAPLCSPEHSEACRREAKRRWEADPGLKDRLVFKGKPGVKRSYSKYGMKVQREKLAHLERIAPELTREQRAAALKKARETFRRKNAHKWAPRPCAACGTPFVPPRLKGKATRTTCGDECWSSLRLKHVAQENRKKRKIKRCSHCGTEFWAQGRNTCSLECARKRQSKCGKKLAKYNDFLRQTRVSVPCSGCGKLVERTGMGAVSQRRRIACRECRRKRLNAASEAWKRRNPERHKEIQRAAYHRKMARKRAKQEESE